MNIGFNKRNGALVVNIQGEIDHHTAENIREKIEKEFLLSGFKNVVLDFSNVNFMDSSGIGMIIGRYKYITAQGGMLSVTGMKEGISKIFIMSGLGKLIKSFSCIDEAIKDM